MPPIALEQIKEVALLAEDVPLNAGLMLERKSFQMLFSSEDQKEGMQAFIENVNQIIRDDKHEHSNSENRYYWCRYDGCGHCPDHNSIWS